MKKKDNKQNSKVSVIMACYNTDKYVWEAIESILSQSFEDFEFVIIDDYSSDKTYEICQEYAKKDDRIKLNRNKKNMWIAYTRNKLISLANTDYIATQDSDDISLVDRISLCYDFLEINNEYWVVSGNNIIIDENWSTIWRRKYSNEIWKVILKKSPISQWSSMFRKEVFFSLWGYDKKLNYWEDYDLWLRMYSKWYRIKNLDKDLYKLRIREWQSKSKNLKDTIKNTIFIQRRANKEYSIKASFWDRIYWLLEKILIVLPSSFVLWLFKKIEYKK